MKNISILLALVSRVRLSAGRPCPVARPGRRRTSPPLLASADPHLAANKKLVYDFWREVFEAGHMDLAPKYMAESYIQHNPNVPTGRAAFVAFFTQYVKKPKAIQPTIQAPLVTMVAEGDKVIISFVRTMRSIRRMPAKKSTTTWFDMFRIEDGKIAEHWDCAPKE